MGKENISTIFEFSVRNKNLIKISVIKINKMCHEIAFTRENSWENAMGKY